MKNFVECFLEIKKDGVCLSMSWISCVFVERCFLNACCASWRMLCASRCCMILLVIMSSSILQVMDESDIWRQLMGCWRSPFFKYGNHIGCGPVYWDCSLF